LNIYELHEHYFEFFHDLGREKPAGKAKQAAQLEKAAREQGYSP